MAVLEFRVIQALSKTKNKLPETSFSYSGVSLWNDLRPTNSLDIFKRQMVLCIGLPHGKYVNQ